MLIAMYFSGRIKGYEHCIDKILEFKKKYNIIFFCSLNCSELTEYEMKFIKLCEMKPEQYTYENVVAEEWVNDMDTKGRPTNRYNTYSHFYNNKKCIKLIEKYEKIHNMQFYCIIKYRADIISSNILNIPINIEPDTVYMPNILLCSGMNDQIGYGMRDVMKIYSNVFDNIKILCVGADTAYHPESLLLAHLNKNKVKIKQFYFNYNLHLDRHQ